MKEAIINLLKVKSLFSLTAIAVILLSIWFPIPDWVQEICKIVVVFYFGTQVAKADTSSAATAVISEPETDIVAAETDSNE